jgi:hypothetical protein
MQSKSAKSLFVLRLLALLSVFIAVFWALGSLTKRYGRSDVASVFQRDHDGGLPGYVAPLVFERSVFQPKPGTDGAEIEIVADYYVWLFGYVWKTPYVRTKSMPIKGAFSFDEVARDLSWASSW